MPDWVYEPFALRLGTIVGTWLAGKYHQGLVCGYAADGEPMIMSISLWKGFATESLCQFMGPQGLAEASYPSRLQSEQILSRARSVSHRPYDLGRWNCQHFVRFAHGLSVQSPQASAAAKAVLAISAIFAFLNLAK